MPQDCTKHAERIARLEEQECSKDKMIDDIYKKLESMSESLTNIKWRLAFTTGFLAALQFISPYILPNIVKALESLSN